MDIFCLNVAIFLNTQDISLVLDKHIVITGIPGGYHIPSHPIKFFSSLRPHPPIGCLWATFSSSRKNNLASMANYPKSRYWIEVILLALPLLALMVLLPQLQETGWSSRHSYRRSVMQMATQQQGSNKLKPLIYTFYDPPTNDNDDDDDDATLVHHGDEILEAWKELWTEHGWEPIVLDTSHAELHPSYKTHSQIFESKHYRHFRGWLAMAAMGTGGWMSTIDCFPLGISPDADGLQLPNNGMFTSYDGTNPSLLSGSDTEWQRMANELVQLAQAFTPHVREHQVYSDGDALRDLFLNQPMPFIQEHSVGTYPYKSLGKVDCTAARKIFAVHLNPRETAFAMNVGVLDVPQGKDIHDRHYFARVLTKKWTQQCVGEETYPSG
jgi:hypothetical protein